MITEEQKNHLRLWVADLRKTKTKQTKYRLYKPGTGYCCLGRACRIYEKQTKNGKFVNGSNEDKIFIINNDNDFSEIDFPNAVHKWFNIKPAKYMRMNDMESMSFKQIADQIEKDYNL
jgi:hypothetical protein